MSLQGGGRVLSLWWIDRESRGSQKKKCKNRIAPLPRHLSSLPIYPITSLLSLFLPPPALLSPMTSPPPPLSFSFPISFSVLSPQHLPASFLPPQCPFTHPLTPTPDTDMRQKTSPSHWVSSSSHSAVEALKTFFFFFPFTVPIPDDTLIQ